MVPSWLLVFLGLLNNPLALLDGDQFVLRTVAQGSEDLKSKPDSFMIIALCLGFLLCHMSSVRVAASMRSHL